MLKIYILSRSIILCLRVGECSRRARLVKCDEELRQTIHIRCTGVNMATYLKQAYEKLQVFGGIFSKGGEQKKTQHGKAK